MSARSIAAQESNPDIVLVHDYSRDPEVLLGTCSHGSQYSRTPPSAWAEPTRDEVDFRNDAGHETVAALAELQR